MLHLQFRSIEEIEFEFVDAVLDKSARDIMPDQSEMSLFMNKH